MESSIIDCFVKDLVDSKNEKEETDRFQHRLKVFSEWKDKHSLKKVKAGDKIDVRDTEYIWCPAIVETKIEVYGKTPLLYIHYENWNRRYDEYLLQTSNRVAPLGLYTSRTDIPRYYLYQ